MVLTPKFSFNICQPVVVFKELTAKDAKGAKKIKRVSSKKLRGIPSLKGMVRRSSVGTKLLPRFCR